MKSNFTGEQVADTAELIVQDFDDLSLTAFQDCINKIKMAKPPFDKKLYESIDGRKLFEYLNRYREFQIEHLEKDHKFNKHKQPDFELDKMPVEIVNGLDDKIVEMQRRGAREVFENPIPKLVKKKTNKRRKSCRIF